MKNKAISKKLRKKFHYLSEIAKALIVQLPFVRLPVLVYQMGKVGSTTIYETLKESGISSTHIHVLLPKNLDWVRNDCEVKGIATPDDRFRRVLARQIRKRRKQVRIITLVRDPISQNFSSFFQNFERVSGRMIRKGDEANFDIDEIVTLYRSDYSKTTAVKFFDNELGPSTGIDVYRTSFPHEKGYQILQDGPVSLLILRVDTPDSEKVSAINEFLGTSLNELKQKNISSEKAYADLYAQFKKKLKLPRDTVAELVDSKYCRHFFTERERAELFDRWVEQ